MPLVYGHNVYVTFRNRLKNKCKRKMVTTAHVTERRREKRNFTRHLAFSFTFQPSFRERLKRICTKITSKNNSLTTTHLLSYVAILTATATSIQTCDRDEDACYSIRTVNRVCDLALAAVRFVYFSTVSIVFVQFENVFGWLLLLL